MIAWGKTHKGLVRQQNEDAYKIIYPEGSDNVIGVVCDGMGGARAGDVASDLAVRTFAELAEDFGNFDMEKAVYASNRAVFQKTRQNPELSGMGTTLVAVCTDGKNAIIANVGDSRAYIWNETGIKKVTIDHSVVENLLQTGEITEAEANTYPGKHLITRALGTDADVEVDIYNIEVSAGQYILLCSDGLTNMVEAEDIKAILDSGAEPEEMCDRLIDAANANGGRDNITVLLIGI